MKRLPRLIKIYESGYAAMYDGGYRKSFYSVSSDARRSFKQTVDNIISERGWSYFKSSWWFNFMKDGDYAEE